MRIGKILDFSKLFYTPVFFFEFIFFQYFQAIFPRAGQQVMCLVLKNDRIHNLCVLTFA